MAYQNILIPVDGSETAFEALKKGIEMAKKSKAKVTALYVIPEVAQLVEAFNVRDEVKEAFHREGQTILDKARELAKGMGFSISTRRDEGTPYEKILEAARILGSDLIVIGSHGNSAPAKFLLGSCTQRVLAGASCPVLVVRE